MTPNKIKEILPDLTLDDADKFWPNTEYAFLATHQDINPINGGDAAAFFCEGYYYARRLLEKCYETK